MPRRIALLAAGLILPASAAAAPPPKLDPGPAQYPRIAVQHDVPITMRDGVRLYADVYRPAGADGTAVAERLPVILTQTPYNKNDAQAGAGNQLSDLAGRADLLVRHGYVQVIVDVRGTGSSGGAWDSFGPAEQDDEVEVARWATSRPWSDGRLATYGASYMAINQFFLAARHPPGLKAIFPIIPAEDVYRDVTWHGGSVDAGFIPLWLGIVSATKVIPPQYLGADPGAAAAWLTDRTTRGVQFSAQALQGLALGNELAYDGSFYRVRSPGSVVSQVRVPTFITGGWYDIFQRGEPRLYQQLRLPPGRKQLLMGPWYHVTAGDGLGEKDAPPTLPALALAWFDRWVKHVHNGVERFGPITVEQLGADRWARQRTWPRKDVGYGRLYLRPGGALAAAPPTAATSDTRPADPVDGLCTRSTVQWTAGLVPPGQPCASGNRLNEAGALTYTTAPLRSQMHLSGPLSLTLRASTTAKDTTWIATVSDVSPDGASDQITAGWLMMSRRAVDRSRSTIAPNGDLVVPFHPFTRDSVQAVTPGETETLNVEIFNTDAVLEPGHRLRLALTNGDLPHLVAAGPDQLTQLGAVNSVRIDPAAPSYLTLPLVGGR